VTKLKKMIKERGIKITDLAKRVGIGQPHMSLIVNGERRLSADMLMFLSDVLDCDPADIYGDVEKTDAA